MNRQAIQNLIDKYYNGETTMEEERALFNFLESDTTSEFQSEKAQFLFFKKSREEKPTQDLFEGANFPQKKILKINFGFATRIAALLIIGLGISYFLFTVFHKPLIEHTTRANVQSEIKLPDGSLVWLHNHSRLRYPTAFDKDSREVFLEGEAYFEIRKDSTRPFIVHTHEATTKVVGTSFDLRNYAAEEHVELTVFTGKVIFGSAKKVEVASSNSMIYEKKNGQLHPSTLKGLNSLAWKTKRLKFEDTPLDEVLIDLARYYNVHFEMKSKAKLNCHFSGNFNNPQLEDMLNALSFSMNVKFQLNQDVYYIDDHNCGATQ
ncbi:MAG TPA: FecR domain-containing protein [Cyclobacteriaceae bacterium]|jgi:ferric-dicitrate binding protein FerR (iron transport regulator)|nr:FecR domain-containing protein [Cyclobacteriaceae bacterium]